MKKNKKTWVLAVLILLTVRASAEDNKKFRLTYGNVIYTPDTSNSALGTAFRDPAGLVWGEQYKNSSYDYGMPVGLVQKTCESIGARLPTLVELEKLKKNLTDQRTGFYNPYLLNQQGFVFPDLKHAFSGYSVAITEPTLVNHDPYCALYEYYYLSTDDGQIRKGSTESGNCCSRDGDNYNSSCYDTEQFRCVIQIKEAMLDRS